MLKLLIMRHAESSSNVENLFSGHQDVELTKKGIWQAEQLAERLAETKIDVIYSSDLKRAISTANIINKKHQLTLNVEPLFKEIHFGDWEGMCYEEVYAYSDYENYRNWWRQPHIALPGGESIAEVNQRVTKGLKKLITNHGNSDGQGKTVAIVCHGGVAKIMIGIALDIPLERIWYISQHSAALNIIIYENQDSYYVEKVNDTSHLDGKVMVVD